MAEKIAVKARLYAVLGIILVIILQTQFSDYELPIVATKERLSVSESMPTDWGVAATSNREFYDALKKRNSRLNRIPSAVSNRQLLRNRKRERDKLAPFDGKVYFLHEISQKHLDAASVRRR